ncbi:serine-rich adhesin for platelets-like [Haliotis rufescens]|uniref:serine-rich adhesin for platelets-like n=1 Tax=Haliotis rufescens TaxID=6454 RepID=UPI00201F16AE|nr:serine-rich adhesin for platelets-like [Haliotis rufescens]
MIPKSLFVSVGIDTDLEQTLTSSTSQTPSLTLLSKQQGPVISSAPVIQDVWESPSRSVGYASQDVSISRYISTITVQPTSTLMPSIMDSTPSPGSESTSDTTRGLSGLKVQSPVRSDSSSSGLRYLQSPCRSSVSSVGFSSLITSQEMDSTVVGDFLEQSASSRSIIVKGTETPLIFTSMRSPISETSHTTNHLDTLYSISTSAFISNQETATFDQGLATDGDPGITGVESETISSSTTDNGDPGISGVESETISSSTTDNVDPGITGVESETISSSTTDNVDPGITGVESETISSSTTDNVDPGITGVESETISSSTTDNVDPGITGVESETISSSTTDNVDPGITGVESETISSSTTDNVDPGITGVESETISSSTTDNVDPGITGVESETISSSTTDYGDLLHPTSESVTPSSTKRQPPSDTTTAPMIAAAPSEAVMSSITNSSYIYTCSSYYSENEASSCPCLRMLTNAVASSCHASSGASVVLTCRVGWGFPEGQSNLTVQCWDATWTPEPLHCVPGGSPVSSHYSYLAGFFKQSHFHNDRHLRY